MDRTLKAVYIKIREDVMEVHNLARSRAKARYADIKEKA